MRLLPAFILLLIFCKPLYAHTDGLVARTTNRLTMVAYGLGEDRLGGAKAGYIDSNILLRVIDSTKDMYLVKFSGQHKAYISKADIKFDTASTKPFYLANSWSVKGDDLYDYININLDERLPYKSWMEIHPSKIMVDIYGVQSNSNWINQLASVKEVKNVYFNQVEDDVMRVTIELKHEQHWGYSARYLNKTLSIRVRRQPKVVRLKHMRIAIDAGHGGSNTGAVGITSKVLEKHYTIRFANELEKQLSGKCESVFMTRTSDTNVLNTDRVFMLQDQMPHIVISLHLNSSALPTVHGTSTYYKHIGFRPLSANILNRLLELELHEFGNVGNFNFTLNAPTDFVNTLVEVAFLSNPDDEKRILDPRFQNQVAKKIYKGIKDWLREVRRAS